MRAETDNADDFAIAGKVFDKMKILVSGMGGEVYSRLDGVKNEIRFSGDTAFITVSIRIKKPDLSKCIAQCGGQAGGGA